MRESTITVTRGGVTFDGPDAVNLFRAATLRSALGLLLHGIVPRRGLTRAKALAMVTPYTGQKYGRSGSEIQRAMRDISVWIETMRSAIPTDHRE